LDWPVHCPFWRVDRTPGGHALALGAILSAFYLWRRDLVANIIGHFLVDFVANVLPKLFP